jgi:3-mercaptopyruvate sulfurtransferase SseA
MAKKLKGRKKGFSIGPAIIILVVGIGLIATAVILQNSGSSGSTASDIPRVSLSEAKQAFDSGQAIIVDVRSESAYQELHTAGAINIPYEDLQSQMSELNPDQWVITYCT